MVEADLHISPRLKALLPALTAEEREQLEANIVSDGRVRDAILYWHDGKKNLIVDGMNRYEIAHRKGLPYRNEPMVFDGIDDVELWMLNNALGRRNLMKPDELRKVVGEMYNRLKGNRGGNHQKEGDGAKYHGDTLAKSGGVVSGGANAAQNVAGKAGVSAATVKRDGKYVESLGKLCEPVRNAVNEGRLKVTDAQLHTLAKAHPTKQLEVARSVRTGAAKDTKEAMAKAGLNAKSKCQQNEAGHEWESDGDGKRFCIHCKEDYPDNKKAKPAKGKEKISAAKLVDQLTRKHVGHMVRGLDAIAVANGGKGPVYKAADTAINEFIGCLKKMRDGEK